MSSSKAYPKLVFITSRFPYPLEKGDKLRAYYQIKELSKRCDVHLISLTDKVVSQNHKAELEQFCTSVSVYKLNKLVIYWNVFLALFGKKPLQVAYFYHWNIAQKVKSKIVELAPNHIYSQLIRTSEYVKNYHNCPKTLDYMDALSKGMERRIQKQKWYSKWAFKMEAKRLNNYERSIFDYFEHKIIISEQDKNYILHPERHKIICVPNGIDTYFIDYEGSKNPAFDFVFVGNMSYPPNVDAVKYIIEFILPHFPAAQFLVAGATPHPDLIHLSTKNKQITIAGWVEDIRESYSSGKIFLAPMMIGTGMQNKLLEAMAIGIPCVTTDLANNAIKALPGESIIVANNEGEFVQHLKALLNDENLRREIGEAGKNYVKKHFSWTESTKIIVHLIQS